MPRSLLKCLIEKHYCASAAMGTLLFLSPECGVKDSAAMIQERFEGCLLGLALGDAMGAPYEGGYLERGLWGLIGRTASGARRWTDDTQMSLDIAESLIALGVLDLDDLAHRFAASYRWSRGYGPGAARLLKRIAKGADWREVNRSIYPGGSFGNGGAMRAPMIGLCYAQCPEQLVEAARLSASITHAHPLGIEGAVLLASATRLALGGATALEIFQGAAAHCNQEPFVQRLALAAGWLQSGQEPSAKEVARSLGNGIEASQSCVTALYIALRFLPRPFAEMLAFIAHCRGDVDTIGAMAGAIWGAARGASHLPAAELDQLEACSRLRAVAAALYQTTTVENT
ncbi:MAG: ADP-ribosylglycohydrolase family protein [Pseudomonas sp.]|uniref:ADP-ribosylglycohydrolase family protein n=1 Tax=Pseudomonas sp. TaxID=306 RepID=UPI003396682F